MNVSVKKEKNSSCLLDLELPFEFVLPFFNKALSSVKSQSSIKGFRTGKAPLSFIKQKFPERIRNSLLDLVLSDVLSGIIEEQKLRPLGRPVVTDIFFEESQPMRISIQLELYPEFSLKNYKGLSVTKFKNSFSEEEFQKNMKLFLEKFADFLPKKDDRDSQQTDYFGFDYVMKDLSTEEVLLEQKSCLCSMLEGSSVFFERSPQEESNMRKMISPKDKDFYCDIIPILVAMKNGESVSKKIVLSEKYPIEKLKGKEVLLNATLHQVYVQVFPELNEEFFKKLGDPRINTRKELEDFLRNLWESERSKTLEHLFRENLFDELVAKNPFELPLSMLHNEKNAIVEKERKILQKKKHPSFLINQELEKQDSSFFALAKKNLSLHFLFKAIADRESIVVSEDDILNALAEAVVDSKEDPSVLYKNMEKSGKILDLKDSLKREKVISFLIDSANIEEKLFVSD